LALPLAQQDIRVINTQDVMQAALLPALVVMLGWALITWFTRERAVVSMSVSASSALSSTTSSTAWLKGERWALAIVPLAIVVLLTLVAMGRVRAVEAAATAGVALFAWGLVSRQLNATVLREVLDDAMTLTGALFALLLAATSFSLLLRALGTDTLVTQAMLALRGHPLLALLAVLGVLLASSFVLDAFELTFLVVPIVMPPLLAQVGDAAWVAALTLLVLQLGFLLPPFGYAVVLAQAQTPNAPRVAARALLRSLAPFMAWSLAVVVLVLVWPTSTHWLRTAPVAVQGNTLSSDDVEKAMREMSRKP
jgi:TRAP-type mannitol/chloroaromatic compound transport system permease large subunit